MSIGFGTIYIINNAKIYTAGQLQIFKRNGNTNKNLAEANDYCKGIVENIYIEGIYLGVDTLLLTSFTIFNEQAFAI